MQNLFIGWCSLVAKYDLWQESSDISVKVLDVCNRVPLQAQGSKPWQLAQVDHHLEKQWRPVSLCKYQFSHLLVFDLVVAQPQYFKLL